MSERLTDEALANIAALLRDEQYMMQCDGFAVMLNTAKQAATAIDELLANRRATPDDDLRALNECQHAINRIGKFMGVVPGVAQCADDIADEAIKRLAALSQNGGAA